MKPSRRNLANAVAKAERLAAGKPALSSFERKRLTDEEIMQRLNARTTNAKGGVVIGKE